MLTDVGWVLTSALYLDAKWAAPFDPDKTEPGPFTVAGGKTVTACGTWTATGSVREVRRLDRRSRCPTGREAGR